MWGIVLGGGGAKGFAHIGVLKVLVDAGFSFDAVAGTSIGALVGALYAADKLPELETQCLKIRLRDIPILLSPAWSVSGMFSGANVLELLTSVVKQKTIEELPKKFAAVAVDLDTAEVVTFTSGDIATAIRASIAIPGFFTPVCYEGRVLIDGGTADPLPVRAARDAGARKVLAVDLFGRRPERKTEIRGGTQSRSLSALLNLRQLFSNYPEKLPNLMEVIERTLSVVQNHLTRLQLRETPADFVIYPDLRHISPLDFHKAKEIIALGETAAQEALPELMERMGEKIC